ncbi:hypothetical protein ITI46_18165 [Streptomyces oryzae]|uniref:Lipoprotein n=1 Tax=Streptomyces oryzae TaxID=1434886 RepID=A0ABS3XDX4_9ACTN|nr:hypothetical protein [Streptomyces oryzae]MBO8193570.1 hypothetical protein [Streptomyces oryzae]
MRITTGAVATILAVLALGACSGGEDNKPDPEPPARTSTEPSANSSSPAVKIQYENAPLTLGGGTEDKPFGSRCHPNSAALDGSSPEILKGGFAVESEPDLTVEPCGRSSEEPEVLFSTDAGHLAFRATDQQDGAGCNAAMNSPDAPQLKDPIPFSELRAGQKFCNTHPYDQKERVELLRVRAISPKERTVTFSVSAWEETD